MVWLRRATEPLPLVRLAKVGEQLDRNAYLTEYKVKVYIHCKRQEAHRSCGARPEFPSRADLHHVPFLLRKPPRPTPSFGPNFKDKATRPHSSTKAADSIGGEEGINKMRPDELIDATNEHIQKLRTEAALEGSLKAGDRPKTMLRWRKVLISVLVPTVERSMS